MKAAIYARVSTTEELQDPDNQLKPLRDMASALGAEIYREYVDYASGGDSNRPQFQAMLADARSYKFNLVLVWSLDRFSREGIFNTLGYFRMLKNCNVGLKSLQESWLDTRDEGMGQLLIAILSWVAEQEKKRISERIKAALKQKKNVGKRGRDKKPRRKGGYYRRWDRIKNLPPKKGQIP
jgi:DNA invertase Pin-like site-specific DNA recombinase